MIRSLLKLIFLLFLANMFFGAIAWIVKKVLFWGLIMSVIYLFYKLIKGEDVPQQQSAETY